MERYQIGDHLYFEILALGLESYFRICLSENFHSNALFYIIYKADNIVLSHVVRKRSVHNKVEIVITASYYFLEKDTYLCSLCCHILTVALANRSISKEV